MKHFFTAALLLLTLMPATAQPSLFEAGIETGPSALWMRGNDAVANFRSNLVAFPAGVFLQRNINRRLAMRIHLQYDVKGVGSSSNTLDAAGFYIGSSRYRYTGRYMSLPVLLRVYTGLKRRFFVNAGPYAAFLMKWTERAKQSGVRPITVNTTGRFERFDAGLCAGAGISWPLDRRTFLTVEARYSRGLVNISAVEVINQGQLRTDALQGLVGFSRKLGGRKK